jgi:alpha-L-fucosidase
MKMTMKTSMWREIEGRKYYLPGEVSDPDDRPRSDAELLGMALISRSRGTNLLLSAGPDRHGTIPQPFVDALSRLSPILFT